MQLMGPTGRCLLCPFILRYANIAIGRFGRLSLELSQFHVLRIAVRFLAPVLAVVLAIDWFIAPSTLTIEDATRLEVTTKRIDLRRARPHVYLVTSTGREAQVGCDKTARLCEFLESGSKKQLTVWIVEPAWFYGTWLVAANDGPTPVVPISAQNRIYSGARALNGGTTVVVTTFAIFLWRKQLRRYVGRRNAP
jgi:hypothetical protein